VRHGYGSKDFAVLLSAKNERD